MKYYLYIIETIDNTLYCGTTNDIVKRYNAHLTKKGAKYTISHPPKKIVYLNVFENKSLALKEEYRIKKTLSRDEKLKLVKENKKTTQNLLEKMFVLK